MHTVRLWRDAERWRFACPNGHTSWQPQVNTVYCQGCTRDPEVEHSVHDQLLDRRTGERILVGEVKFVTWDE